MEIGEPTPLPGGMSGETFRARVAGEDVVVRIYGGRSVRRGPKAPEVDAAVLSWVRGLLPVAEVLEVRRADPEHEAPGLLVTSLLPGVRLEQVLPDLDDAALGRVGDQLGTMLGRLALIATPRPGLLDGPDLAIAPLPPAYADLPSFADHVDLDWPEADLSALGEVLTDAQALLDTVSRTCLVHGDVNAENVLVDPDTLEVTGLVDWEFAHAGSPYADLGNLLRFDRAPAYVEAVLEARGRLVPDQRPDALDRARAADLFALLDLAARAEQDPVAARATGQLRAVVAARDVHGYYDQSPMA
ncbi:aminoglycoside phosphotransferase family protein [Nocardioides mangrovicus]|uniref:Aminoglycoside phosphotransferase family protein n=1 Tax=Nocardioides mangrovicus TaxID=2478913 RepID=A0A3L8P555_9ACTN|nr:aminoglycoside phosphotransferase family protein [Nocardioides mangrovicus]RLV49518.1 aminoglycoside phosphotransferase family protein [Nocardioides mangrovicus]